MRPHEAPGLGRREWGVRLIPCTFVRRKVDSKGVSWSASGRNRSIALLSG